MGFSFIFIGFFLLLCVGSMGYIYAFRGQERYQSINEYLRKGWPVFSLFNCTLYTLTQKRAAKPIMDAADFPELSEVQKNWSVIRDEAVALHKSDIFNSINNPTTDAYYDVGFRTFYKYGWRKFYLKWYGYNHQSAQESCPNTLAILNNVPSINGAMFSILPPHSQLTRHLDPVACSLRYHLGLQTPNSDQCFINVDGQTHSWRDGQPLIFDETYLHFVRNDTDEYRLILMCDIERPMNVFGKIFNWFYKKFMRGTLVPNTSVDKIGWISATFRTISPIMERGKVLKKTNPAAYKLSKHLINFTVLVIVFGSLAVALQLLTG